MPASELKLDRSFVHDLDTNEDHLSIVRAVIGLAHALGLRVVCEGVENEATLLRLRQLGCDLAQGYCVSKPLAARDLPDFVAKGTTHVFSTVQSATSAKHLLSLMPKLTPRPALRESLRAIRIASGAP
jgi:predicted signal transduction protein with EAL and GGDEF domain